MAPRRFRGPHPVGGLVLHCLQSLIVPPLGESLAGMAVGASPQTEHSQPTQNKRSHDTVHKPDAQPGACRKQRPWSQAGVPLPLLHKPQKRPDFTSRTTERPAERVACRLAAWQVVPRNLFLRTPVWGYVCLSVRKMVILHRIRRAGRGRASHAEVTVVTKEGPCWAWPGRSLHQLQREPGRALGHGGDKKPG